MIGKRTTILASVVVTALFFSGRVLAEEHGGKPLQAALDGKAFVGELGKEGKMTGDKDDFVFKNGKFRSTACDQYGFGDGVYSTTAKGDMISFESKTESPTDGKMEWKGTVKGEAIEGTAKWSPPGKSAEQYWFKGTLKK